MNKTMTLRPILQPAPWYVCTAFFLSACAITESDVHRWEQTERGPDKLVAVVTHNRYKESLRIEAALSLVRMHARGGRTLGLDLFVQSLTTLEDAERTRLIAAMTPELVRQIQQPPPAHTQPGVLPTDPSIPFKDATFALLSADPPLIQDPQLAQQLHSALLHWVQTDVETRLENTTQHYGLEQMMRFLGPDSVRALPDLMTPDTLRLDRLAGLVAELGAPETKARASKAMVALAQYVDSAAWVAKQTPLIEAANAQAKTKATPEQFQKQVAAYREQELLKLFGAIKRIGGAPARSYSLSFAADKQRGEEIRKAALASLEGNLDKKNTEDAERLFALAKDNDIPDGVRDLAFSRLGELPKEMIVAKLYTLFDSKWKIRWVAAVQILKHITTKEADEFFQKLPASSSKKMGMSEPISYGANLVKMETPVGAPSPRDIALRYLDSKNLGAKLTALGYFYGSNKGDLPLLKKHENDTTKLPVCTPEDECGWVCEFTSPGGKESESKVPTTVGEFVRYCLVSSVSS